MANPDPADDFRWTGFFQRSTDPLFVLNRRRQLLFVNRAWEALTGFTGLDLRKRVCKRQRDAEPGSAESVLSAISPSREVLQGQRVTVRRLLPRPDGPAWWWDVEFLPLSDVRGVLGVLGVIHPVNVPGPESFQPIPEKLIDLRAHRFESWSLQRLRPEVPALQRALRQVKLASETPIPVLLLGERGVGKEWLARAIHVASPRRERSFVGLDCLHLPPDALAWALFGPQALASRAGTLYLHEVAHLPREIQSRFCEQLPGGSVPSSGPRLLAGSSEDCHAAEQAGRLLPEFHALLTTLTIAIPPLRERQAELPRLVEQIFERIGLATETPARALTDPAWEILRGYSWPGNLDELFAVLAGACKRTQAERIDASDLPAYLRPVAPAVPRSLPLDQILEQVEKRLLQLALASARGNRSKAAELLQIWRPRLLRRLEALGIDEKET